MSALGRDSRFFVIYTISRVTRASRSPNGKSEAQIRRSLCFISSQQFCWEHISRWQVLLICWVSAIPYLKALPGNKCAEVSEPLPTSAPHHTLRGSIELKVMALIWEQLLQCMDPLCLWEAEDMERGFGVQLSWSLPGITHLSTPGSILEASERTRQNTALRPLPEMGSALCSPERHLRTNQRLSRLVNSDPGCRVRKSEVIYEVKNSINSTQTKTPPLSAIRV